MDSENLENSVNKGVEDTQREGGGQIVQNGPQPIDAAALPTQTRPKLSAGVSALPSCFIEVRQLGRATGKSAKEIKELLDTVFATLPPLQVEYINGRCTIAARNEEQLANAKRGLINAIGDGILQTIGNDLRQDERSRDAAQLRFVIYGLTVGMFGGKTKRELVESLVLNLAASLGLQQSSIRILEIVKNQAAVLTIEGAPASVIEGLVAEPRVQVGGRLTIILRYPKPTICWRCGKIGGCDRGERCRRRCLRCASTTHDVRTGDKGEAKGCAAVRVKCFRCTGQGGRPTAFSGHRADARSCPALIDLLRFKPKELYPENPAI